MTFGEIIKQARKGRFSQKELGDQVGVWDTYIGQIEKGGKIPSDEICVKLARALGLDERKLLLLAYRKRASGYAKELFDQMDRIMEDPVVDFILSKKDIIGLDLLEILKDDLLREALRDPSWLKMFVRSYRMKDEKNIPGLIEAIEKMSQRQWKALLNMMEVLTQGD